MRGGGRPATPRPRGRRRSSRAARRESGPRARRARRTSPRRRSQRGLGLGHAACDPDAARERVLLGVRHDLAHRRARRVVGARGEHASCPAFEERDEDLRHLLGRLPFGENGFGSALAKLSVDVDAREAEIAIRKRGELLECVLGCSSSRLDGLEQCAQTRRAARPQGDSKVGAWAPRPRRSRGSGAPLPRLEDEALLRGAGRFIDDLDPVANARHAAILRSPFAHARITRLDRAAALELPGVVGVLTGADVAAMSRPFPAGIDSPIPLYAAAHETARYAGEPVAVVVARDRYLAEDALELIEVEYEPLEPVLDPAAAAETEACVSDRSFHYGDVDAALSAARPRRPRAVPLPPLELHARRVLRRRRRLERAPRARSPPGRTSRARSRSTPSPRQRSASPARSSA